MNFSQADYHSLVVGGAIFDSEVGSGGTHFVVRGSRLAKFVQDAEEAAPEWPVFRGSREVAIPKAIEFVSKSRTGGLSPRRDLRAALSLIIAYAGSHSRRLLLSITVLTPYPPCLSRLR